MDIAQLLLFSTPLILAALGELVGQRSGVLNIGLEGMMLLGGFSAFVVASQTGSLVAGFAVGCLAGLCFGVLSSLFTVKMGADQVVVGTAINLLALGATGLGFHRVFGQSGKLLSSPTMPTFLGIDWVVWLAIVLIPTVWWVIAHTNWGLAIRACGEYPKAVESAGFSVSAIRMQALAVGGLLAGLGGAHLALSVDGSFQEGMTAGRGFMAIAIVTFGRWRPAWVALAALLLGYANSLQFSMQGHPVFGVAISPQLWLVLPYVVALLVLVVVGRGTVVPGALGRPYKQER